MKKQQGTLREVESNTAEVNVIRQQQQQQKIPQCSQDEWTPPDTPSTATPDSPQLLYAQTVWRTATQAHQVSCEGHALQRLRGKKDITLESACHHTRPKA